jgi:DNA-binding CsgD family transcriptional regulator
VLSLLLAGHRVASLGRALSVRPNTVRNHLRAVFRKLHVHSQEDLIEMFRKAPGDGRP